MSHIFISYSHEDSDYARKLEGELKRRGFEVWIDDRIDYGTRWPQVIQDRLDVCAALVLIMTPRSYSSEWVQNELARAKAKRKPVFPLLLEGDYWLAVQATQCVDVRGTKLPPPAFYERLGRVLSTPETTAGPLPTPVELTARSRPLWMWIVLALVVLGGSFLGIRAVIQFWPVPTKTPAITSTAVLAPTSTHTPTLTNTPVPATPTLCQPPASWQPYVPRPGENLTELASRHGTTVDDIRRFNCLPTEALMAGQLIFLPPMPPRIREKDGAVMVYVPAGEFWMGSDEDDPYALDNEKPRHQVFVDAFWIDRAEVTNSQYRQCVEAGVCSPPGKSNSADRRNYYSNPEYDDYPVIHVSWLQARKYAEWVDGRLPTEAEWEYACRGPEGSTYPWGENSPDDTLLNYGGNVGDTTEVGSYPEGRSWCGALDMSGNVWEWTQSIYTGYPYDPTDGRENLDVGGDVYRVVRGGSFLFPRDFVHCAVRNGPNQDGGLFFPGFRVASPISP